MPIAHLEVLQRLLRAVVTYMAVMAQEVKRRSDALANGSSLSSQPVSAGITTGFNVIQVRLQQRPQIGPDLALDHAGDMWPSVLPDSWRLLR